ncbi:MAG TPA: amidase family protein, partial [Geminicoccaceae bacterium]|nr:amidase family protein [Geminicoccaceae bacterium]
LGVPERFFFDGCSPGVAEGVRAALDELAAAGARLVPFELPEAEAAFELWRNGHLSAPEAYTTLRTTALSAWVDTLDPNVWTRMSTYGEMSAAEYIERRRRVLGWMEGVNRRVAAEVDAFVAPTIPITAPTLDEVATLDGYRERNVAASRNAAVLSLFDLCAVTLPVALDAAGIPVGMQVATARGREARLLGMALAMERRLGTARERLGRPPLVPAD